MTRTSSDTTAEAAEVYTAAFRSLTGSERVERSIEMAEEVKQITMAGIAHRNPDFTQARFTGNGCAFSTVSQSCSS